MFTGIPDFAEVYSFIGSVFDPTAEGHVQKLKEMDPINFETVSLIKTLCISSLSWPANFFSFFKKKTSLFSSVVSLLV